jgi:hypothetical protein
LFSLSNSCSLGSKAKASPCPVGAVVADAPGGLSRPHLRYKEYKGYHMEGSERQLV